MEESNGSKLRDNGEQVENIILKTKNWIDINFKKISPKQGLIGFMVLVIISLGFTGYKVNEIKTRAFEVYVGETKVATIREEDEALKVVEDLQKNLINTYNADIIIDDEIRFEPTHAKEDALTPPGELRSNIRSKIHYLACAYVLVVDGEEVGALKTKEEAESILEKIKEPYMDLAQENQNIKEVKIVEDVKILNKNIPVNQISDENDLIIHLETGSEEIRTHIVEVGETFSTIALIYNMPLDEIYDANPGKDPTKLQIGEEVKLVVPKSVITVATVEEVEYTERVNYETEIEYNDKMYKNEKKVKKAGENGENKIIAKETKHNGILVDKTIVQEETIKKPTTEIIVRGTKEVPKTVATGALLMPIKGRISSRYGMRNGRMHRGLDIVAPTGTPILAADGGTVVFSGYKGAYGNMIEINHGNGYVTRYAHASKLLVGKGTKVYKGQHIANVGNTGRSTGPHLHLEVLKNGVYQNPSNFVK